MTNGGTMYGKGKTETNGRGTVAIMRPYEWLTVKTLYVNLKIIDKLNMFIKSNSVTPFIPRLIPYFNNLCSFMFYPPK